MDGTTGTRFFEGSQLRDRLPVLLLAVAAIASGVLLLRLDSQLSFFAEDWLFLVKRPGWSADHLLDPYHGHLIAGVGVAFNLLLGVFGMGSATPYFLVAIAFFLTSAIVLFFLVRRRIGDWMALFAAILIFFLGAAFEDLFFAFQVGFFASVAAGLGALIALDRKDEAGDISACALLIVSLAFGSIGIAFVVGAVVNLVMGRGPRGRHIYVALLPILLYGLWWLVWGHQANTQWTQQRLLDAPGNAIDGASAGILALLGLASGYGSPPYLPDLTWGHVLLVIGSLVVLVKVVKERSVSVGLATALAIGVSYWFLLGSNRDLITVSRYRDASAIFLLLIAAETLRGVRIPRLVVVGVAALTGFAVVAGVSLLHEIHEEQWRPFIESQRSTLAAVDVARGSADPAFQVSFPPPLQVPAREYYAVTEDHGSPAFTEAELAERPESERVAADVTIAQALGLATAPLAPGTKTVSCQTLQATELGETGITLLRGGFRLENQGESDVALSLGRFSEGLPVNFGPLAPNTPISLYIPEDESTRPWRLGLTGSGPVRLCTTG